MKNFYYLLLLPLVFCCSPSETAKKVDDQVATNEEKAIPIKELAKVEALTQPPEGFSTLGNQFITGRKWVDNNGENLLLFTFSKESNSHPSGDEAISHALYVEHFSRKQNAQNYQLIRKIQDFEKTCILENMLHLDEKSINITDLDNNQYKEISFVYTLGCKSDISPYPMKLMLLENGDKYAIRGNTRSKEILRIELGENADFPESTDKNFDPSFEKAPAAFKKFANNLWNAHELKQ